jgi:hypothetical protein
LGQTVRPGQRLHRGLRKAGIGAEHFVWPPPGDPDRAPYRGWEPLEEVDAAVFFGRDGQIVCGLDALRGMRRSGIESLFGDSGSLRGWKVVVPAGGARAAAAAGRPALPRPGHHATGAQRAHWRPGLCTRRPRIDDQTGGLARPPPGKIKDACTRADTEQLRAWLAEARQAAAGRLLEVAARTPPPAEPVRTGPRPHRGAEQGPGDGAAGEGTG